MSILKRKSQYQKVPGTRVPVAVSDQLTRHDVGEEPADSFRRSAGLVAVLGLLLLVFCETDPAREFHAGPVSLGDLGRTFGEALVVAALLAVLVDRRLKLDLAKEISNKTSSAFFRDFLGGRYLPDDYYNKMRELAATDVLSLGVEWHLDVAWADELEAPGQPYLKMTSTVYNTFKNTGSRSHPHAVTWLMYLRDGRPPSQLTRCELTVTAHNGNDRNRVEDMQRAVLTAGELAKINERIRAGKYDSGGDRLLPEVPPGATAVLCAAGTVYHSRAGIMPLVCRYPTLGQDLTISGPALADLVVEVRGGVQLLRPARHPDDPPGLQRYHTDGLALAGSTLRVQWAPRTAGPAGPATDESPPIPMQSSGPE